MQSQNLNQDFRGYVDGIVGSRLCGWVCNINNLEVNLDVEIYVDDVKVGETRAKNHRKDLKNAGFGNGNYGFSYNLSSDLLDKKIRVKIRGGDFELPYSQVPTVSQVLINTANNLKREGKLEQAIVEYRRAIRLKPGFSWFYYELADALTKQNNLVAAVENYCTALQLNPNQSWFYYRLSEVLLALNRVDEATNCCQKAVSLNPTNQIIQRALTELLTINNPHLENKVTQITHNLKSLLLIGFPRGFTSQSYEIIKKATGLRSSNVSAGEVLNRGRLLEAGFVNESLKLKNFPFYTKNLELYPVIEEELNKYKKGFIIKDVVHPWLVLEYISRNPTVYNVLFVSRNLNEVIFHLNKLDWRIYTGMEELQDKFRHFPTLDVELAMHNSDYLFDTVEKLGYAIKRFDYIDRDFIEKREKTKKLFEVHGNSLKNINSVYNYVLEIDTPIKLHLHEGPVHPCLGRQGWSYPEPTGIWTQKKVAELIFYVDSFYESDLCLLVEIEGVFVHKNHPKQTIEVFANETLIDKWHFNYAAKIDKLKKCTIPCYVINSNSRLFISFHISNPESPLNLGISGDTRKLGFKINRIQFLKV